MTDMVFVNADRTKVVKEGSPDAAMQLHRKEAERLGLLKESKAKSDDAPAGTKIVPDGEATATTENAPTATRSTTTRTTTTSSRKS